MRYRAFAQVLAGALVVIAAAAMRSDRAVPQGGGAADAGTMTAAPSGVAATFQYAFVAEGDVIREADVVVRGTIVAVSEPRWNQENGARWSMEDERPKDLEHPPAAFILQGISVKISDVWRGSEFGASEAVEFVVPGNGIGATWNEEGAFLTPGTDVVLLLDRRQFGWRDGPDGRKDVLTLSGAYQGVYRVEPDGRLTNASLARFGKAAPGPGGPERASTLATLRSRVRSGAADM